MSDTPTLTGVGQPQGIARARRHEAGCEQAVDGGLGLAEITHDAAAQLAADQLATVERCPVEEAEHRPLGERETGPGELPLEQRPEGALGLADVTSKGDGCHGNRVHGNCLTWLLSRASHHRDVRVAGHIPPPRVLGAGAQADAGGLDRVGRR